MSPKCTHRLVIAGIIVAALIFLGSAIVRGVYPWLKQQEQHTEDNH